MKIHNREIFDISPVIHDGLAVFPGDTPFFREQTMSIEQGDHLGLSWIKSTLHLGAHADAPNHYSSLNQGIESQSLSAYLGAAQVIEVPLSLGQRIYPKNLSQIKIEAPRVLFKTLSFPNPDQWREDFCALSSELVDFLASQKVLLVGIDTPSIDLANDKNLESHSAVSRHKMSILEGILLNQVPPGLYDLVALPLKIKNADASPVRAILLR